MFSHRRSVLGARSARSIAVAALVVPLLVVGTAATGQTSRKTSASSVTSALLAAASHKSGVSVSELKVGDQFRQPFAFTGQTIDVAKVVAPKTGKTYLVALDSQGRSVDYYAEQAADTAARERTHGKLDPALSATLNSVSASKAVPVSIWLKTGELPRGRSGGTLQQHLASVKAAVAPVRQSVLDGLAKMGVTGRTSEYAPAVFANLNAGQITKLQNDPHVATIYGQAKYRLAQDDSATTERINPPWLGGRLGFSTSSRPAVHEPDGVSDFNPDLNNGRHPVVFYCSAINTICPAGKQITSPYGGHASRVAGAIASTNPLLQGIAPSSQMIISENSQDFSDTNLVRAFEWGRGNGADPTNMSWGTNCGGDQTFFSRYVDWATKNLGATVVASSGNNVCGNNDHKVSAPSLAWTAISVGAIGDNNDGWWPGDFMSSFSNYVNPNFATGMEKPEVVAVGQDQCLSNTTTSDCGNAGTSFSGPQIAGQVSQLLSRQPGQNQWPETNKAMVLSTAWHDIVSGTSQDGLGAPVMNTGDVSYGSGRFFDNSLASGQTTDVDHPVALTAGQQVKFSIAWDANSNGSSSDVLDDDVDLHVLNPNGSFACTSVSVQNAWESCDFTAATTGTYTFRAHPFNATPSATFLGFAWGVKTLPNLCTTVTSLSATVGAHSAGTVTTSSGPTFLDSYPSWPDSETGREKVFKLVLGTTRTVRFNDTNNSLDLFILSIPNCTLQPFTPTVRADGINQAGPVSLAAGTYYIVVDGFQGAVGSTSLTYNIS